MESNLHKNYSPKDFEDRIYETWEKSGSFHAEVDRSKKPFTIVIPPPNITGQLHMGHALDQTCQDVMIRWKRMQGYNALWLPGTDHASIATEVKVAEGIMASEGKTKEEYGREAFLERAWEWKHEYGGVISRQMRKLGNSCDWERERFTMDEGCNRAVITHFVNMYKKGLIYKGNRMINWCPCCRTSISDIEVEHEDKNAHYWYFTYPGVDGGEGIVIATSRPETMFADVAVAVHPEDARYRDMLGKMVKIPLTNRVIPIIADVYPDPDKGTGAVKITPAHDVNDFEVGERHGLDRPLCIDENALMTELAGKYEGMDRFECRKAWAKELSAAGFLVKTEEKTIPLGHCYRCQTAIEPMLSEQWFVKMKELAQPAMRIAQEKDVTLVPDRFEKVYLQWLEEIRDWCISRQLWWGHRIPAYYCQACGAMEVGMSEPSACPACGHEHFDQDEDVLDTWFSSALWPFSTLGWPDETEELEYFYPTDVLVTGYDIIFFWVVRMAFSGMEVMKETPFRYVYVHGLVRDAEGRKMSKSLGNGIDPLEVIDQYGADALRLMLIAGTSTGNDMRFQNDKLDGARNFANKLWNASRFVIMNLKKQDIAAMSADEWGAESSLLKAEDQWILFRLDKAVSEITRHLERFDLSLAAQRINSLIWDEFCDWYIEFVKNRLYHGDDMEKAVVRAVLLRVLKDLLKLLHPFMPFITEEIWSFLPKTNNESGLLIKASWPVASEDKDRLVTIDRVEKAMEIIKNIRNIRAEAGVAPSKQLTAYIFADKNELRELKLTESHIRSLGKLSSIFYIDDRTQIPDEAAAAVTGSVEIYIPLDELTDYEAEYARLHKEAIRIEAEIARVGFKLANQGFISKAPAQLVQNEKDRLSEYESTLVKIKSRLERLPI